MKQNWFCSNSIFHDSLTLALLVNRLRFVSKKFILQNVKLFPSKFEFLSEYSILFRLFVTKNDEESKFVLTFKDPLIATLQFWSFDLNIDYWFIRALSLFQKAIVVKWKVFDLDWLFIFINCLYFIQVGLRVNQATLLFRLIPILMQSIYVRNLS